MSAPALALHGIVKRFGTVTALDGASLMVAPGTVHALLGENGAGKTTLMRIAYGLARPDAGLVQLAGRTVRLRAPSDAIDHGLGMVQQHFSLVPAMTVTENIELGRRGPYRPQEASERVRMLSQQTSLHIDPDTHAADLPPASQQKLELLKIFSREARTLILDEPTAVLAPAETEELIRLLRHVANEGGAVVLVTHKLREALVVADEVTVLRRGRTVLTAPTHTVDEAALARAMFSDDAMSETFSTPSTTRGAVIAEMRDVELRDRHGVLRIRRASIAVHAGELLGLAGIEGSGHHEVLLALAGRLTPADGDIRLPPHIAFIPEHRQRDALILGFSLAENVALRDAGHARGRIRWQDIKRRTRELLDRGAVRASSVDAAVSTLSGGNQQKLVLARELEGAPALVVAENPTQGLDVRAAMAVRARLRAARTAGAGVVVYTSDLDELLAVADRVVVVFGGRVHEVPLDPDHIGRAMLGALM